MRKTLLALAALASTTATFAQSSVTIFGVVDATFAVGRGSVANRTQLTNSGYNSSRLGFRGTEDLGGGVTASFWLEAGMANDDGTGGASNANNQAVGAFVPATGANAPVRAGTQGLTFNRRSTVSISSRAGELRLGRDYTPQFWNVNQFDPFGSVGTGNSQTFVSSLGGVTSARSSNGIGYLLPGNLGGFYGQAQYYMGENPSNAGATKDNGNGYGLRVGYAAGPLNVAVAASRTKYATGDARQMNVGGTWDLGMAKVMGHYANDSLGTSDGTGWLIGGLVPAGAGEVRLAYSRYKVETAAASPRTSKISLGYVHNLSKRTALYGTYARVSNSGGATQALNGATTAANGSSSGFDLGVRHSF